MRDMTEQLTLTRVRTCMLFCLFLDHEMKDDGGAPDDAVIVEGAMNNFGFHPGRLEESREEITAMLMELSTEFMLSGGGGMSLMRAVADKHDNLWGEQKDAGDLMVLGMAIGKVKCVLPRQMWHILPGGMPYYTVLDKEEAA